MQTLAFRWITAISYTVFPVAQHMYAHTVSPSTFIIFMWTHLMAHSEVTWHEVTWRLHKSCQLWIGHVPLNVSCHLWMRTVVMIHVTSQWFISPVSFLLLPLKWSCDRKSCHLWMCHVTSGCLVLPLDASWGLESCHLWMRHVNMLYNIQRDLHTHV